MNRHNAARVAIQGHFTADTVNLPLFNGYPPLTNACIYGDLATVQRLLAIGADSNHPTMMAKLVIQELWKKEKWIIIVVLMEAGMVLQPCFNGKARTIPYISLAVTACRRWPHHHRGWKVVLEKLLTMKLPIELKYHGNTTLGIACAGFGTDTGKTDFELIDMVYQAGARNFPRRNEFNIPCSTRGIRTVEQYATLRSTVDSVYSAARGRRNEYLIRRAQCSISSVTIIGLPKVHSPDVRGNGRDVMRMIAWMVWETRCQEMWSYPGSNI